MKTITLCLIAKNEEAMLPACLESVKDVVDRIVVVDTGSTDRTVEIAEGAGATVVHHAWNDDFAAARNAALDEVDDGFVLLLDADERLAPGAGDALRRAARENRVDCGLLPLVDASSLQARVEDVVSGKSRRGEPQLLARFFRRTPDLRWEGIVHEQVSSWLESKKRRMSHVAATIVHYGAVPELRKERGKDSRNRQLLEKRVEQEPNDPLAKAYLARERRRAGELDSALDAAEDAWRTLVASRTGTQSHTQYDAVLPATLLAYLLLERGRNEEAGETLHAARGYAGDHPNLLLLQGLVHERTHGGFVDPESRDLREAEKSYQRALARRGATFVAELLPGACGWAAATRLGTVRLLQARPLQARRAFDMALREAPGHMEAELGRVESLLAEGCVAEAVRAIEPLLVANTPDGWILAAAAGCAASGFEAIEPIAAQARRAISEGEVIAPHRIGWLEEVEQASPSASSETAPALVQDEPSVSVVIPLYNRLDLARTVIEGFLAEGRERELEIVVVDDGSEPPVEGLLAELGKPESVCLVRHGTNKGRGEAINSGVEAARGDLVIVCDADVVPKPGFVADHVAFHVRNPSELATHLGSLEWGVDENLYAKLVGARCNPRMRDLSGDVDWTLWFTDNWSFKRSLFSDHGYRFDPAIRLCYFEDLELSRRLVAGGVTSTITGTAPASHIRPANPAGMIENFRKSVPNLLHLARVAPELPELRVWLGCRSASVENQERVERLHSCLWERLESLDSACKASGGICAVRDALIEGLARSFSAATFRVGIGRGFLDAPDTDGVALPPVAEGRDLLSYASLVGHVALAEARFAKHPDLGGLLAEVFDLLELDASQRELMALEVSNVVRSQDSSTTSRLVLSKSSS